MRGSKSWLAACALVCVLGAGCATFEPIAVSSTDTTTAATTSDPAATTTAAPEDSSAPEADARVHILLAGDNLISDTIYRNAAELAQSEGKDGYDFTPTYEHIARFVKAADLAILNQETIVTDEFEPSPYPCFCSPEALGDTMVDLGFNAISMSNNHVIDKGEAGFLATLNYWDEKHPDVVHYGAYRDQADMDSIATKTVNGITFAFLGYMEYTNGLSLPDGSPCRITYLSELDTIKKQVEAADKLADVVVVSCHYGVEITNQVSDLQYDVTQDLVNWGADLIVGTQAHTIQECAYIPREDGTKAFCYYGLGNLVSTQETALAMVGALGDLYAVKDADTGDVTFEQCKEIPVVTFFPSNYSVVTTYPLSEYTDDIAKNQFHNDMTVKRIKDIIKTVPAEFLSIE
ncbi:MAG: CapA family protein [Oscillospiraceae bacterium]